jgi:replicative superfamily II helicase
MAIYQGVYMANEGIKAGINELREKLAIKEQEAADLKKAINVLLATIGEGPEFAEFPREERRSTQVRPDQFFRKSITAAAYEYLKAKGGAASVDELIDVLKRGGCDLGASPLRNVKISLSKNSRVFAEIGNENFGLWEFYGGSPKSKKGGEPTETGPDTDASQAPVTTEGV